MDIVEQKAKEYSQHAYPYTEKMRFQCETHFEAGWQAAMEHLRSLPVRESILEICKESKGGKQ